MTARGHAGFLATWAVGAVALGGAWLAIDGEPDAPASRPGLHAPSLMAAGAHADQPEPSAAVGRGEADWQRTETQVFTEGSLRGTDFPSWGVRPGEALSPQRALRDRFDHYLLGAGETTWPALSALVAAHARRDLGEPLATEVLAVWDRYLRLQHHPFQQVARPGDLDSMTNALQEHRQVRQTLLGLHWAHAFYGEEETRLAADIDRARAGTAAPRDAVAALLDPPPGVDPAELHRRRVAAFGPQRASALQRLDEEDAAWQRRLTEARAEVAAVQADPALSGPQRRQALAGVLASRFPEPSEQLRATGLLGL